MRTLHFISQIKLRVQLLLVNLLIKKINNQNMRTDSEHILSYEDFQNGKWKLCTEQGGLGNDAETDKGSNWQSAVKKGGTATEKKSPPSKKIKLKQHLKTEQHHASPRKIDKIRMRTSSNHHTPLQEKNLNLPNKNPFKHKTNLTEFFPISEAQPRNMHHFKTLYSELCPSPKKRSIPYSSTHKESIHIRQASKSQERSLSKSKKKIHFTVFQTKERSKGKKSPVKEQRPPKPKIDFLVPYRQHPSITINLFERKENKEGSKSKPKLSNSKESIRSRQNRQRRSRQSSLQRKPGVSKTLIKRMGDYEQDERVRRTLQRLEKYRFVGEYMELWEIVQKIAGFTKNNEPQCKWALLIVDEVFKRIRQDNKFEALVSK